MRRAFSTVFLFVGLALPAGVLAKPQDAAPQEGALRLLLEASKLIKRIPEGQQVSAAANIASQLARAGNLEGALDAVRNLKNSSDQWLSLGLIAWQMDHAGHGVEALELLKSSDMQKGKGAAYQQLALSHLDRGDFGGAISVLDLLPDQPNLRVDMLIRIAKRKAESKDLAGARGTLQEALELAEKSWKEDLNCLFQMVPLGQAQAEIGDQAGAYDTLRRFSEIVHQFRQGQSPVAIEGLFQQLAIGQANIGDLTSAFLTIEELPEGASRDIPLNMIATQQAKRGDLLLALKTVSQVSDPQLKALELREIGVSEGIAGKLLEAQEAINEILSPGGRAFALATLALEQAEKEDPRASGTLKLAIEAASEPGTDIPGYVFQNIVVTRAVLKDFSGAEELIAKMSDPASRVWPLWNMTEMMAEGGDIQGALSLATNEQDAYPKAYALLGTAQGILKHAEAEANDKSKSKASLR